MTLADLVDSGYLQKRVPLGPLSTYKFGGVAQYLFEASGEDDLLGLARVLADHPIPVVALGRGSNVVISDHGFPGVVIRPGPELSWWRLSDDGTVAAGAATPLPVVGRASARRGRGGLEFFVGIPGSIGGAVRMNAGCFGTETADRLVTARIVDMRTATARTAASADLDLRYRHSNLQDGEVVVEAAFMTIERDAIEAEAEIRAITRWRKDNQPGGTYNAGSVFKNPPGDAAGRIIDELGLKGLRVGGAAVSDRHANFFVADESATSQDVYDLVSEVRKRVADALGVELHPEVRFLGSFRAAS